MPVTFRPGTIDDNYAAFRVHDSAITDIFQRFGIASAEDAPSEEEIIDEWEHGSRSLYEHLARTAEHFWVAEQDGEIIGYSRSSNYGGVRVLNEFFVKPGIQSKGVGKELLARAFPRQNARLRMIIATLDMRAQSLYMRSGVYARGLLYRFSCKPQAAAATAIPSDLVIETAPTGPEALAILGEVDGVILGYQRDSDHSWLLSARQGWLYRRQGEVVGYGYTGENSGPFALLNPADYPAVLAHGEQQAAAAGHEEFAVWVHSSNQQAIDYLFSHHYKLFPFVAAVLSDLPFGKLNHYINTSPPFLI